MSYQRGRQLEIFKREDPPRERGGSRESPSGAAVHGNITVKTEESPRTISLDDAAIDQLAARLTQRLQPKSSALFGALAATFLASLRANGRDVDDQDWHVRRLEPLWSETEASLTVGKIEELSGQLARDGLSAVSINKVRSTGKMVVRHALAHTQWFGPNPFALLPRLKEAKRTAKTLTIEQLRRVERGFVDAQWRRMFRVAVHTGMREGELFALEVGDLDFNSGTIRIARSHERGCTKTGVERTIPMHPALESDLLAARREAQQRNGVLLFPSESGEIRSRNTKSCIRLRAAMVRAGVAVLDVTYKCRRETCQRKLTEPGSTVGIRICACGWKMWSVPRVDAVRWYDLRHICATLHHEHGADPLCRALALGHHVKEITDRVYTHPSPEMMRRELTRWSL